MKELELQYLTLEVTNICNLNCKMCFKRGLSDVKHTHMSLDTFKKALDDAHPTTGVTFVGLGEPLMNPDFYEMLVESKKRDLIINFATNGVWYACCLDSNNELEFGNLSESTILEVYNSYKRNSLIDRIKDKQFKSIGSPCDTVIACL